MRIKYLLAALFTIVIWGISLPVTTILLRHGFTPNLITFLRFLLAAILLYLFLGRRKIQPVAKSDRIYVYLMGAAGTSLFFFFENSALKFTTVSNTSLITATIPLFTLLAASVFYQKKILWQNLIGIPLGLLGTSLLFFKDLRISAEHLRGDLLALASVAMWIVYSFSYRKVMDKYDSLSIVLHTFLYGCLFSLPLFLLEFRQFRAITMNYSVVLALLYLAILCSFLGYYLWTLSLRNLGVKTTSNLILLIPIVSVSSSILWLHESLTPVLLIAAALIICSAFLTSVSNPKHHF